MKITTEISSCLFEDKRLRPIVRALLLFAVLSLWRPIDGYLHLYCLRVIPIIRLAGIVTVTYTWVVWVGLVWLFCKFIDRDSIINLGLHRKKIILYFAIGLLLGIVYDYCANMIVNIVNQKENIFPSYHLLSYKKAGSFGTYLYWLYIRIFPPAAEEIVYRGYILQNIRKDWGTYLAVGISSILFALCHFIFTSLHFSWSSFAWHFVFGVLASLLYLKSKSLWMPIGFHASDYLFSIL